MYRWLHAPTPAPGDGGGGGITVPIPNVGVPDKDTVLDTTSNALLGIPEWGWTIIAALIIAFVLKVIFNRLNFKVVAGVLLALFLAAYFGKIGH